MADAAVSFLVDTVRKVLVHKLDVVSEAERELELLQIELRSMKSFLEENSSRMSESKNFQSLERQIRDVVYKVEDVIDESISKASSKKSSERNSILAESVKKLREQDIKVVFDEARSDLASVPAPEEADQEAVVRLQLRGSERDKTIVGFEDAKKNLIGNLTETSSQLEAISIIGMPELEKTTVASQVYTDPNVEFDFPARIWINVSVAYNPKDIYLTIIRHFTNHDMSGLSVSDLAQKVRQYLNDVKFLLVADDVWTVEAWKDIKTALPFDEATGKVLITSRYESVARSANPNREPHKLRFLTPEESWKLLQLEVYSKEGVWPSDLKSIGKSIAEKCSGLPLALVLMGGILLDETLSSIASTKKQWDQVSKSLEEYLIKGDKQGNMDSIISLSYDKLPHKYRNCFLYLGSVFPEDSEISAWNLTRLWIAEGFIKKDHDKDMSTEEVAEAYLKELIKRNLVMSVKKDALGEVKKVLVHDMIRRFCQNESEKLKLSQEVGPSVSEINESRRICLHSGVLEFFEKSPNVSKVRSFICFSKEGVNVPLNFVSGVLDRFRLIRVFEGSAIKFPKFSPALVGLIHLRYLALSLGENFKILPESIGNLWRLETIVLQTTYKTIEMRGVSELKLLRHLKTKKAALILTSKGKTKDEQHLENLQTLTRLSTESCKNGVLRKTPNLRTLGIRGDLNSILDSTPLKDLRLVSRLKLKSDARSRESISPPPNPDFFPPNLKSLALEATNLAWAHMDTLGTLPKLETLELRDFAFRGETWNFNGVGFGSLSFLRIERSDLREWTIADRSFRELKHLIVKNCENLVGVPLGLVRTLETLDIERVSKEAVISAVEIGEHHPEQLSLGFKLNVFAGDLKAAGIKKKF